MVSPGTATETAASHSATNGERFTGGSSANGYRKAGRLHFPRPPVVWALRRSSLKEPIRILQNRLAELSPNAPTEPDETIMNKEHKVFLPLGSLAALAVLAWATAAAGQSLRVSFDDGVKADRAAGRAEPWVSKGLESVPGKFGKAVRLGARAQLVYAGEQNVLAGRGTLAFWCQVPQRPGPVDIQRLIFV